MKKTLALLIFAFFGAVLPATAQDAGLVGGTFSATHLPQGPGCAGLLITGQFLAPAPGYQFSLEEIPDETTTTVLAMKLTAQPPTGQVAQVVTLTPVVHGNPAFAACPYGVSIAYENQRLIVPFMPASAVRTAP